MRSTFKVLFYINRTRVKNDGMAPVMCRISVNGTIAQFSCRLSVDPVVWDLRNSATLSDAPAVKHINREIAKIQTAVEKHYRKIFNGIGPLTAERVKTSYLGLDRSCRTILQVFCSHNENYLKMVESGGRSMGSYRKLDIAYRHLKEYIKCEYKITDVALIDLRYEFITGFDMFLREKKHCATNTVLHYITPLRKMIAISRDNGWIDHNPFSDYHINRTPAERGYLTIREIKMLIDANYTDKRYSMLRDFYLFCCFTGVPHVDIRLLKWII